MNNIIDDYRDAVRAAYGNNVADNLEIQVKDGWYHVVFKEKPVTDGEAFTQPTRYRKTQLQTTIANLKAKVSQG